MLSLAIFDNLNVTYLSVINGVLAWIAACVHGWAAYRTSGLIRKMFLTIASVACFYSLSYWWLAFNPAEIVAWSQFLRPFGIFTWIVAWAIEPLVLVHYLGRQADDLLANAHRVADKVQARLDE